MFDTCSVTLETGRGYCFRSVESVDQYASVDHIIEFAEAFGYELYRDNNYLWYLIVNWDQASRRRKTHRILDAIESDQMVRIA
jgi:hypothetical protein